MNVPKSRRRQNIPLPFMDDCLSKTSLKQAAAAAAAPRLLDDEDDDDPVAVLMPEPNDPEWAGDTLLATGELDPLDEPDRLPARSRSSAWSTAAAGGTAHCCCAGLGCRRCFFFLPAAAGRPPSASSAAGAHSGSFFKYPLPHRQPHAFKAIS